MKNIITVLLAMVAFRCPAQEWSKYKFDDNLTLTIPKRFTMIDTMGQHLVRALIDNGMIIVQRLPNKGTTAIQIKNKEDLQKQYTEFQEGMLSSQQGTLVEQRFSEIDGLFVSRFSCKAMMGVENQLRYFLLIFLNENWYVVQFWEVESLDGELKSDRDELFSSVEFASGATINNQLSNAAEGSLAYRVGYVAGSILMIVLFVLAIVFAARQLAKRLNKKNTPDGS
jgi:hypothetical protein